MSHSSVKDKRTLTRRLGRLPHLTGAIERAAIGYEAARLVTLVATPHTDPRWTERAAARTVCHLREEVDAALVLSRLGHDADVEPPTEQQLRDLRRLEARIVSGATVVANPADEKMSALTVAEHTVATLTEYFERRRQTPRALRSRGRVTRRFTVSRSLYRAYRRRERLYLEYPPSDASFLYFACSALLEAWAYALPPVAYNHIYERDGHRCSNPFCSRRDVTPHQVVYRSRLGTDDDDNVIALCTWCHLEGVHGGRITRVSSLSPL